MDMPVMGAGSSLSEEQAWESSVELIATQLHFPLSVIKLSAEGLARQLREACSDPNNITAAESLAQSAERMSHMVQALIQASRDGEL